MNSHPWTSRPPVPYPAQNQPSQRSQRAARGARLARGSLVPLTILLLVGCQRESAPPKAPQPSARARVQVETTEARIQPIWEEAMGSVRPEHEARLESKIQGRVEAVWVSLGQPVKRGERIVQIESTELEARVRRAEAVRDQLAADLARHTSLLGKASVTLAEFEAVRSRSLSADAELREAKSGLDHALVLAPMDGVVARKWIEPGDLAMPGRPLIQVESTEASRFETQVSERATRAIQVGSGLSVEFSGVGKVVEGKVIEFSPSADDQTRTFAVTLRLPSVAGLRSGMYGKAKVPVGETRAIQVPAGSVLRRGQLEYVFVVDQERVRLRLVRTAKQIGERVQVVSGLEAGEAVVISSHLALEDGEPVEIRP